MLDNSGLWQFKGLNELVIIKWLIRQYDQEVFIYIYYKFELSVCLCLTNYASNHQNVDMGHTYEG